MPTSHLNRQNLKYDANQFKRDWSAIEKVVDEISSAKEFPLTEDEKMCRFCVYRSYCNRGTQAGQIEEAEAEMESEATFDVNFEQISEIEILAPIIFHQFMRPFRLTNCFARQEFGKDRFDIQHRRAIHRVQSFDQQTTTFAFNNADNR